MPVKELQKWDMIKHKWQLYPGNYSVFAGSNANDEKLTASFVISK
jgi:beta-glucosidase